MFKTKTTINASKLMNNYSKTFIKKKNWKKISTQFRDYVVDTTIRKSGKSPATMEKFKPLENNTKIYRGRIAKINSTHPAYKKNKANLTLSGALLDAIKPLSQKLLSKKKALIGFYIDPRKKHPGYKGHKRSDKPLMVNIFDGLVKTDKGYDIFRSLDENQKSYLISRILKPLIRKGKK